MDVSNALIQAVCNGQLEEVTRLIQTYGLAHSADWENGYVLLSLALEKKHLDVAKLLISSGAEPNTSNTNSQILSPLHRAALYGYTDVAIELLDKGALIDRKNEVTRISVSSSGSYLEILDVTALHLATLEGQKQFVQMLIERGADTSLKSINGQRIEYVGSREGYEELIGVVKREYGEDAIPELSEQNSVVSFSNDRYTIMTQTIMDLRASAGYGDEEGAVEDVNDCPYDGVTALHFAIRDGFVDIVIMLLKHSADVRMATTTDGRTPLHFAVIGGHEDIVKILLKHSPDVNAKSSNEQWTPLHYACNAGYENIVKMLIEHEADVQALTVKNETALHLACNIESKGCVKLLLNKGAKVRILTVDRETPLHIASRCRSADIVKVLLEHGADINTDSEHKETALHYASAKGHTEVIQVLLEHGADVNAIAGRYTYTPLYFAARLDHQDAVKALLVGGATGSSYALYKAITWGRTDLIDLLLDRGADINGRPEPNGWISLHYAVEAGSEEIVRLLLERNVDVNAKTGDRYGKTALHIAVERNDSDIIEMLLRHNADVNCKNDFRGDTPLHMAIAKPLIHANILVMLLNHKADVNIINNDECVPLQGLCIWPDNCKGVLIEHLIKMIKSNLYVSEDNLKILRETEKFQSEYEAEKLKMAGELIGIGTITYMDILTKGTNVLVRYLRNEEFSQLVRSEEYKTKFPFSSNEIASALRKAFERKELLEGAISQFLNIFCSFPELPQAILEEVFSAFKNEELKLFIDSYYANY